MADAGKDDRDDDMENPKTAAPGNAAKPADDWVTGDEAMTGAQAS